MKTTELECTDVRSVLYFLDTMSRKKKKAADFQFQGERHRGPYQKTAAVM